MGNKIRDKIKTSQGALVVFTSFVIYVVIWSSIVITRLDTLNALWADLGIAMERGWLIYHNNWGLTGYLYILFNSGILFITFPITFPQNYAIILIFQTVMIGGAVFPIYKISKYLLNEGVLPIIFAILYLVYFPISGINWYDFHYQSLFPILFLSGYYFYLKEQRIMSLIFLTLSSMVKFPYAMFSLLFALIILLEIFQKRSKDYKIDLKRLSYPCILILISSFLLIGAYFVNGNLGYVEATVGFSGNATITTNLVDKVYTILLIFLPLLFLPLLSKKFFILYMPYFALVLYIGGYGKIFPTAFHYQYTSMIVPFVFLGLIDFFHNLKKREWKTFKALRKKISYSSLRYVLSIFVVLITIFTAALFEPYGPLNHYNFDNFNDFGHYDYNSKRTAINYLDQVISLIPKNNNSVLTQFNIPEIYPREPVINTFPNEIYMLVAGHSALAQVNNLTLSNVKNNTYNVIVFQDHRYTSTNISIYYALGDYNSPWYYTNNPSMEDFINLMNASKEYGMVANYHGFILLEWHYNGPIKLGNSTSKY
ncbi:MAG: DUF2079 domain-containing protein [Thermoplasmatales archaeon]